MGPTGDTLNAEDQSWMDEMARQEDAEWNATQLHHTKNTDNVVEKMPYPIEIANLRGGYDQNKFAKWLIGSRTHHYISLNDTGEVLYYDGGVYKTGGERDIEEMVVKVMDGEKISTNNSKETVFLVKRRVGHERTEIDSEDGIINLLNGLYSLQTNEISKHTPEYLSVRQMNIEYDENAICPNIDKFIREIVDEDDVRFIYELFGYTLLSNKRYSTAAFFEGDGANGKSVLMDLMKHFVGAVACAEVTPNEMGGDDKYAIADLFGKALNVVDDLGNDVVDGVGAFKSVITGNSVRGQRKYGHAFAFIPNTLCVFGCNEVPATTDTSEGYYRRMRIVTFPNKFEGDAENKNLLDELITRDEISGLFNAAVKAIRDVIVRGEFTGDKTVEDKRREYMTKSNNILMFIYDECDITDVDATVEKDELYNQYVLWARDRNTAVKEMMHMTTAIKGLGCKVARPKDEDGRRTQCYKGIQLKPHSFIDDDGKTAPGSGVNHTIGKNADRQQKDEKDDLGQGNHRSNHYVSNKIKKVANIGNDGMTQMPKTSTDSESTPDKGMVHGVTQPQTPDPDIESKLKHAVGKAIAKSDTMGAEVSMIVECYPGSISTSNMTKVLVERCAALGMKELYGKWYIQ